MKRLLRFPFTPLTLFGIGRNVGVGVVVGGFTMLCFTGFTILGGLWCGRRPRRFVGRWYDGCVRICG